MTGDKVAKSLVTGLSAVPAIARSLACALLLACSGASAQPLESWIQSFADSEIEFARAESAVPFPPIAFLSGVHYGETELSFEGQDRKVAFEQNVISQAAIAPFLLGSRDVVAVGEWMTWSRFESDAPLAEDFDIFSIGLPIGWLRQVSPDWQTAAFVMPLGHKASLPGASWTWETMGGVFARYQASDELWWAFGFYADIVGSGDNIYLPYVGASWVLNEHWTLSAIIPWPAVLYAPSQDTLFRLGAAPSGASWSADQGDGEFVYDLDAWDLGLSVEHRFAGNFWASLGSGVGGLRGLRLDGGEWEGVRFDADAGFYIRLAINFRPALPGN